MNLLTDFQSKKVSAANIHCLVNNKNIEYVRETENDDIHKNNEHENKPGLVSMLSDYDKGNIGDEIKNENTK